MKLIELLEAIDFDNVESGIKVQICHPRRSLEDYDTSWEGITIHSTPVQNF